MIQLGKLHHVTLCVADLEATRRFYAGVLGMEEVERPTSFDFQGQWFRKHGYEIHTIHASDAGQVPGDADNIIRPGRDLAMARHFCFSVRSVQETVQALQQHGIEIIIGPRPRGDGATQLYVYDPDGHMVELVYEPWDWE